MMDEAKARKRLKAIERELKYLKKKRERYMNTQKKAQRRNKSLTKKNIVLLSILISALISVLIMFFFTYVITPEGNVKEIRLVCFSYSFIFMVFISYAILDRLREIPYKEELNGINCRIERLEKEKENILSKSPNLKKYKYKNIFILNEYSLVIYISIALYFIFLPISTYLYLIGDIRFSLFGIINPLLGVIMLYVKYLEEQYFKNCIIKENLGVDLKRLYR